MDLGSLILDIRYAVGDMTGDIYSPYSIVNAINTVLRQVNKSLSNITSDLTKKRVTLTLVDSVVDLPDDFQSISRITDGSFIPLTPRTNEDDTVKFLYEILDNQIYSNSDTIILTYKKYFLEVLPDDLTVILPVPDFFKDLLTTYAKVTLQGDVSSSDATILPTIEEAVMSLVAGRDKSRLYTKMPFHV